MANVDVEIAKMKKMIENNRKYGTFDLEIPEPTNRKELYSFLQVDTIFNEINDKYNEMRKEIGRVQKDGRYADSYKKVHKQKTTEEFQNYKESKLQEIKDKMNVYRSDIEAKHRPVIEDKNLEATQTNSALLQLAFLDNIENNTELMKQFVESNWHRKDIISLVEAKYKDNAAITTQIYTKRKEDQKPYELVDKCLNDVNVFINNRDWQVNGDYIESGIKSMDPLVTTKTKGSVSETVEETYKRVVGGANEE